MLPVRLAWIVIRYPYWIGIQALNSAIMRSIVNYNRIYQYLQVRVDGANHFFRGHEEALVEQVIDWLEAQRN
jgi:alpha/beta superfamily hydrolase